MAPKKEQDSGLVYSTEHGRMCPACKNPAVKCVCRRKEAVARVDGVVRIERETKGRKGKGVTIVTGIPLDQDALLRLAKELKKKCGAGGTVKEGAIEIQGDHRQLLLDDLRKKGYTVKISGG
ncbi:MAG: translation initiation factor Sui1 [Desulforhabdus sp.]|jgi:translation initiation factor 1|nr:translation initiation factor Sui1 [Desulforhabdus sp.]